jgi:hypothetical protein
VDFHVAIDARLFVVRLVRIHHRRVNAGRIGVALQAEEIDVAVFQHVHICSPVRDVAGTTSFYPHGSVLEYEWSLLVRVALEADHVSRSRGPHLPDQMVAFQDTARSVLVVAVGARNQPLVYAMAKRHIELGLLLQVAGIAKRGLGLDQQVFLRCRMVHRVAGSAGNVVLPVE